MGAGAGRGRGGVGAGAGPAVAPGAERRIQERWRLGCDWLGRALTTFLFSLFIYFLFVCF